MFRLIDAFRCACLLSIFAGGAANASSILYVANASGNTVVRIDTAAGVPLGLPIVVGDEPLAPVATADGARVYVQSAANGSIAVIDTRSATVTATFANPNPMQTSPAAIALSPDGRHLYTSWSGGAPVFVLDTTTGAVVATVDVPTTAGNDPSQLVVSRNGTRLYIAYQARRIVAVIDTAANSTIKQIAIPGPFLVGIYGLALSPDDSKLYVTSKEGTLTAVNTADMSVATHIPLATAAFGVSVAPDGGHVYVGGSGGACLMFVDVATSIASATGTFINECRQVAITGDGSHVYTSDVDIATGQGYVLAFEPAGFPITSLLAGFASPVFTSQSVGPSTIYPTTGLWFNPEESGRGFNIETQGNTLVLTAYVYDHDGAPTWFIASGPYDAIAGTFAGTLDATVNGQCLGCPYRLPTYVRAAGGAVRLLFSTPTTGTLFFDGGSTPIQKEIW